MKSEENKNLEPNSKMKSDQKEKQVKAESKLLIYFKNNKVVAVLSILLLVVLIWFTIKINFNERKFKTEKTELITQYESKIDSLNISHLEFATEVFSWSVRSELLRNNTENLNQLLTVFVKDSGADLVQLINPENKVVVLSSDKKFEGNPYTGNLNFEIKETLVVKNETNVVVITPVMGFNNKIGILVVELNK